MFWGSIIFPTNSYQNVYTFHDIDLIVRFYVIHRYSRITHEHLTNQLSNIYGSPTKHQILQLCHANDIFLTSIPQEELESSLLKVGRTNIIATSIKIFGISFSLRACWFPIYYVDGKQHGGYIINSLNRHLVHVLHVNL